MKKYLLALVFSIAGLLSNAALAALTFQTDLDGKLTGASGIMIEGATYTVQFKDGTCSQLFSGCNDASDFIFSSGPRAAAASQALLDSVFINTVMGEFDGNPGLTSGCGFGVLLCGAMTPHGLAAVTYPGIYIWVSIANNLVVDAEDYVQYNLIRDNGPTAPNSFADETFTWAVWSVQTVPEPSTLLLTVAALVSMLLCRAHLPPNSRR